MARRSTESLASRLSPFQKFYLIIVAGFVLGPFIPLIIQSLAFRWAWPDMLPGTWWLEQRGKSMMPLAWDYVLSPYSRIWEATLNTVGIGLAVTVICLAISLPAARVLARERFRGKSAFEFFLSMPLIVPEVNPDAIDGYTAKNIIANPNCSTAQLVVALKPLHDAAGIKRVVVSTYQSVSGAGKEGMDELFQQSRAIFVGDPVEPAKFTKQIAFNVIPHIDVFLDDGSTKEEWKMVVETKKILDPKIKLTATCVRVPVFVGHSEAVTIEFEREITAEQAQDILREAPGIMLVDKREDEGYITPVESVGDGATYISRVREDPTVENGLNLWCVSDNLRKGAALNAVQIAELLGRRHLKKG